MFKKKADETLKTDKSTQPRDPAIDKDDNYMGFGMCIGILFGITFGQLLFHNLATGISIGMMLGLAVGSRFPKKK
ncbi:MAG: hypothetical protein H6Q59_1979 [Firmicutes bacterium]|nr:hypothetical protein [Bacillota bacterium]